MAPQSLVNSSGSLTVEVVSPRVLVSVMSGRLDVELAEHLLRNLDGWAKMGASGLLAFHDWEDVSDYEAKAREVLTPWSKAFRPQFERVHMLVKGRAMAWGLQLVNSITGDIITAHHHRATFEHLRAVAIRAAA